MPQTPLTVLQLVPALNTGGAERSTLEVAAALVAAGHRSIVASAGGRLVPALEAAGSRHIVLDLSRKSPRTLAQVPVLRRLLGELRPDVVHARSRLPAWIAHLAVRGMDEPKPHFVTTVHGFNSPGIYSGVLMRGERVICVSGAVREYMLAHYPKLDPARIAVIPRGIDADEFPHGHQPEPGTRARLQDEHPELGARPFIVLAARGTRLKGHHTAIELLARLVHGHGLDLSLLLLGVCEIGRERYLEELRALAQKLAVGERVAFSPARSDVRDVFALSSLVLQLSRQPETFGRTVLEALSLGVPVLGYAHGGVGELLRELFPVGAVPPGEFEVLTAKAVDLLRRRPPLAPLTRYRLADMQAATLALYESVALLRERRRAPR